MINKKVFVDTNILLHGDLEKICEDLGKISIASTVLLELENIKTSSKKDNGVKFESRNVLRFILANEDKFDVVVVNENHRQLCRDLDVEINNDNLIISVASLSRVDEHGNEVEVEFYSNDVLAFLIAKDIFKVNAKRYNVEYTDEYRGYKEIIMTDLEMAKFYENKDKENIYGLLENEYIIIKDTLNQPLDAWKFNGVELVELNVKPINSMMFGKLKAKDFYQQAVLDSLTNNQITMIKGRAGSGKSHLAMSYLLSQLEKGKIGKIILFINDVNTKDATEHGFLPGELLDKLINSQIGNFLSGKLGDKEQVKAMIGRNQIELIPCGMIRGMDIQGDVAIYITESQNLSVELMKLCIQRIGEGVKVVIDGDCKTQIDSRAFEGSNNGMRGLSKCLKGTDLYGEVELKNIYRSRLADLVDNM